MQAPIKRLLLELANSCMAYMNGSDVPTFQSLEPMFLQGWSVGFELPEHPA